MQFQARSVDLKVRNISKSYGRERVLNDVSLQVEAGKIMTLLGPSGCGKSTLLRIIAGFVTADDGAVLLGGESIVHLPPNRRETAMVFQNYTLFPHMRVIENVTFGMRMRKVRQDEAMKRALEALEMVKLSHLADRYPSQLSGGQMQRVALARALVTQPRILLLDEPFAALDRNLREEMQVELRKLQQALGMTMVCVTHDQREAMVISDNVSVMNRGRIVQSGPPQEIYDAPRHLFTAQFIGGSNIVRAEVVRVTETRVQVCVGEARPFTLVSDLALQEGDQISLAVKPRVLQISSYGQEAILNGTEVLCIPGVVANAVLLGASTSYEIKTDTGECVVAEIDRSHQSKVFAVGDAVTLTAPSDVCVVLEDGHGD
jgi:spermidine/putrescine ABC transporter ATP-binding subunit